MDDTQVARYVLSKWEESIRTYVDDSVRIVTQPQPPRKLGDVSTWNLRLSSAGGCARASGLRALQFEGSPVSMGQMQTFHHGHILEADTKEMLGLVDFPIFFEQCRVQVEYGIEGHIDGMCCLGVYSSTGDIKAYGKTTMSQIRKGIDIIQPEMFLWEHKSLGNYPWKKTIGQSGFKKDSPMENVAEECAGGYILKSGTVKEVHFKDYTQIQVYLMAGRFREDFPRDRAIYFGRAKGEPGVCVEVVHLDRDFALQQLDILYATKHLIDTEKVPPRSFDPDKDWQCDTRWCRHRKTCDAIGDGGGLPISAKLAWEEDSIEDIDTKQEEVVL